MPNATILDYYIGDIIEKKILENVENNRNNV